MKIGLAVLSLTGWIMLLIYCGFYITIQPIKEKIRSRFHDRERKITRWFALSAR